MSPSVFLYQSIFSSTPPPLQYHYKVHLSTCHAPIVLSFPLFFSITICLCVGQTPIHINFLRCFVCCRSRPSITLSNYSLHFPNTQYGFTFLPDGCQKWNYTSLMTGEKKTFPRQSQQANLNFLPGNVLPKKVETGRSKQVEVELSYLGCWMGCQLQRFHSIPQRGPLAGHWCHFPRSRTDTDRKGEKREARVKIVFFFFF